jgi:perosamine synthetase
VSTNPVAPRIRLAKPDIGEEEVAAVRSVLLSGTLTNGPQTREFESAFAKRHEVAHAVAFANGTLALSAIYLGLGIGAGDEVIVPSLTFISTATSVLHVGSKVVFAEVDEHTFNLDPADVERRITPRTRAIVAVHYGGQPADMAELQALAAAHDLELIEDAAEAHGATYRGKSVGGLGRAAMFSFTPTKNITTGEGGIVTTDDANLAVRMRLLRNHGQSSLYEHETLGYNWRMTEMQAAMGLVQLEKLDGILDRKRRNAELLSELMMDIPGVAAPLTLPDRTHAHMLYTLKLDAAQRDRVRSALLDDGIEARLYFPPAHLQPVFLADRYVLPTTERLSGQLLSVPFHSRLTEGEFEEIADALRAAVTKQP